MLLNGIKVFAGAALSGLVIGLPVGLLTKGSKGVPMLKTPSTKGQESLGFQIKDDSSAGGGIGLEVGKTVKFNNNLGIKFGEHVLKAGDKLCSAKQDYNFFLMRKDGNRSQYIIEGQDKPQTRCRSYGPAPKTVKLEGMRGSNTLPGSMSVDTIELSTCDFTLIETDTVKRYKITISNCKTNLGPHPDTVTTAYWEADYK